MITITSFFTMFLLIIGISQLRWGKKTEEKSEKFKVFLRDKYGRFSKVAYEILTYGEMRKRIGLAN